MAGNEVQHEPGGWGRSAAKPPAAPLADSPWFWAALFAAMALIALVAMSGKYSRRQANIEQKFQARERVTWEGERQMLDVRSQKEEKKKDLSPMHVYSRPGDTVIPLWPLAVPLATVIAVSIAMLVRGRLTIRRLSADDADDRR